MNRVLLRQVAAKVCNPFHNTIYRMTAPRQSVLERVRARCEKFRFLPLITVVMPVYNTAPKYLREAIASVEQQVYANWELCIYNDGSSRIETIEELHLLEQKGDKRIRIKHGDENRGISWASNEAIGMASGEFIALLDHDDVLSPLALYEVVRALQDAEYDYIYTDEDKISDNAVHKAPFYKPDWSRRLILMSNYTCHLSVFRKSIGDKLGWFRMGYEGSQDYDLILRFTEVIPDHRIHHIPKVLYHWRMHSESTSLNAWAKPEAYCSAIRALEDAAARSGVRARVRMVRPGHYRMDRAD